MHWQEVVDSDSHQETVARLDVGKESEKWVFETRVRLVLSEWIVIQDEHLEVSCVKVAYDADTPPGSSEESARETHSS